MSDLNYNTGAATAIGFGVGFFCALVQIAAKRKINQWGVVDSNGAIFQFLLPSLFAAIFAAIAQGVNKSSATFTTTQLSGTFVSGTINYDGVKEMNRKAEQQGAFQILAWLLSVGIGAVAGVFIGLFYRMVNGFNHKSQFFNDGVIYDNPK